MKARDRMIYAGIVTSALKERHPVHVREFFRDLLHLCDDHGVFEANAKLLRAACYAPILDRVSERDVEGYLLRLAEQKHGDIKLYTVRGRRFGKVKKWRQTKLKTLVAEYPAEEGDPELPLTTADPPAKPVRRKERKKEVRGRAAPDTPPTPGAEWLDGLTAAWPDINVRAELTACLAKYPHAGRKFFEEEWLPNAEPPMRGRRDERPEEIPEPAGFGEWFKRRYEKEPTPWAQLRHDAREYYVKQMAQ